jgi:hypothetical protein
VYTLLHEIVKAVGLLSKEEYLMPIFKLIQTPISVQVQDLRSSVSKEAI